MIAAILAVWAAMIAIPAVWSLGVVLWLRGKDYVDKQRSDAAIESVRRRRDQAILRELTHRKDIN